MIRRVRENVGNRRRPVFCPEVWRGEILGGGCQEILMAHSCIARLSTTGKQSESFSRVRYLGVHGLPAPALVFKGELVLQPDIDDVGSG